MKKIIYILFFLVWVAFTSCNKDKAIVDSDVQSVIDNFNADNSTELIFNIVYDYGFTLMSGKIPKTDSGVVVTISPLYPLDLFPKTMIINYWNGILCSDGHQRKGRIITVFSNKWCIDSLYTKVNAEVTLSGFYCDNIQHIANIVIEKKGNIDDCPEFSLQTSNSKLIFENGESTLWSANKTIKWISGYQTITDIKDDVFLITGNTTGISREAKGYSSVITRPLRYDNICFNGTLTMGEFEVVPNGLSKRIVNIGNGNCDRIATVTINGVSHDVTF